MSNVGSPSQLLLSCGNTLRAIKDFSGAVESHLRAVKTLVGALKVLAAALKGHPGARNALIGAQYWRLLLDWKTHAKVVEAHQALTEACHEHPYRMIKMLCSD